MGLNVPASELVLLVGALAIGGVITGLLAGLLGIGGGGVIVPILYELFTILGVDADHRMHLCVGTSLAVIIPTSLRSFRSHSKRGAVDQRVFRSLAPWVFVGVLAGIAVASRAPAEVLKLAFIISTTLMAAQLAFKPTVVKPEPHLPGLFWNGLAGLITGLMSTLVGIGGGAYISGFMTFRGWAIHKAVGTASGFGPVIAIPGVVGYIVGGWEQQGLPPLSVGYVSLLAMVIVAPITVLMAPVGVRIAHSLTRRTLERIFIAFLLSVSVRFIFSLVYGS